MLGRSLLMTTIPFVGSSYDSDAQAYITAVEAVDGQALETGVKDAINAFVVGCKSDGIWSAMIASCILIGARTLSGALVPLVGSAPTNYGFVSGDYHRLNGLSNPDGTKYLDSNRANNADPRDSNHNAIYFTQLPKANEVLIGADIGSGGNSFTYTSATSVIIRNRNSGPTTISPITTGSSATGLAGTARNASNSVTIRYAGQTLTRTIFSQAPGSATVLIFRRVGGGAPYTGRAAFYSIGSFVDLELLEVRLDTLRSTIATAIS